MKMEFFCFTETEAAAGRGLDMPVFYVDPAMSTSVMCGRSHFSYTSLRPRRHDPSRAQDQSGRCGPAAASEIGVEHGRYSSKEPRLSHHRPQPLAVSRFGRRAVMALGVRGLDAGLNNNEFSLLGINLANPWRF